MMNFGSIDPNPSMANLSQLTSLSNISAISNSNSRETSQDSNGMTEGRRFECPTLPKGWYREEVTRKTGLTAGKRRDVYYFSPGGLKVRSKPGLIKLLGDQYDLSMFDFKSGKLNPGLIRKPANQKKPQPSRKLPVTMFKTDVKHGAGQEKPCQLLWDPYNDSSAQKKMGNDSHTGMELGSEEKAEENSQLTGKLKPIRNNGMWKMGNEQGKNKSKRFKRNKNEEGKKIKRFKRDMHAPAQCENNANNSEETPEENNNISRVSVHKMATEDDLNNIIQEQVSDSIVPEEESVRTVLRKPSSESFVALLDHDYATRPIPLTKGSRSEHHQNLESAKQEREDESDDEVEILKEIPAGNLKMNLNEMKVEIEDGEILAVTDEETNKTRNANYDDNAAQVIIKEEPENEDDIKNYIESLPVPKILNSKTMEENAVQEGSVDLESPQAWDNLQVEEQQQNGISVGRIASGRSPMKWGCVKSRATMT